MSGGWRRKRKEDNNSNSKRIAIMVKNVKKVARKTRQAPTRFGPVSSISTAPVAIGNSIRGSRPRVTNFSGGARIVGRDFAFALKGTAAAITGWELIGGMPITPSVLPSSVLRNYCQMFANFKVNKLVVHYITSSPTSQAGDVMFYYERDRKAPMCDYSNASFLPYVLSDPFTIIGPQWTNHSLVVDPVREWKSTLYGMNADLNEDTAGSVFLFSKTNATNSPGYVLIDYDISFKEMSVNPRAGSLPISRGQWSNFTIGTSALATTIQSTRIGFNDSLVLRGNDLANATAALPTGAANGDIYKCVACATASTTNNTWTGATLSNLLLNVADLDTPITIDDGYTFYLLYKDTTAAGTTSSFLMYATLEEAIGGSITAGSASGSFYYGVTTTATWALIVNASLVATRGALLQSSY